MSRKNRKQPRSSTQLAMSTPSAVAVASFQRSGAGKHGGSDRARNRRDRKASRESCRNWNRDF